MRIFFITAALAVMLDQITKYFIKHSMSLYESIVVIKDFFSLTYIENSGISFGMFGSSNDLKRWILVGIIFIAICAITAYWIIYRKKDFLYNFSCGLILGGALGNFIDRVLRGSVTDFLEFGIGEKTFPVFNGADTFISVGVGLFIIYVLLEKEDMSPKSQVPGYKQEPVQEDQEGENNLESESRRDSDAS